MDISCTGREEICSSLEKAKTADERKDFISDLPDAILVHILSFLPIKDAINTILLRRFGDLWRSVQVLDFDSCLDHNCDDADYLPDYHNDNFVNVIHYVLNHHDSSTLDKLCFKFGFGLLYTRDEGLADGYDDHKEWEEDTAVQIEKLIRYAISKRVKVLDLDLKGCKFADPKEFYGLPDVLSSNYLTYLKLTAFNIRDCKTIDLKSLSVLFLHEVSLSDDLMDELLLGCPSLENLSLVDCYGLLRFICKNPMLKKVMLTLSYVKHGRIVISCPHVLSLEINGFIRRVCILDVSSEVDASVTFNSLFRFAPIKYDDIMMLLKKLSQCKTFRPCTRIVLVLAIWNFTNVHCPSFGWKNLILNLVLTKWHHPGLSLLFKNSQSLETLAIYIAPASGYLFMNGAEWIHPPDVDMEYWDSQEAATFPCLHTIMIYGNANEPSVIQMVKFMLRSSPSLQKLVVSTTKPTGERLQFTSEPLQALSERFMSLPRASVEANIYFS